jgi:methylenetetrahydrofolate dehydrogenase (NADP+)/methenyltetrahydrofolate cyclohydrolase
VSADLGAIVDGNALSRTLREEAAAQIAELVRAGNPRPSIAIVQSVGEEAADVYTRRLQRLFSEAGVGVRVIELPAEATVDEARPVVDQLSADPAVHAVQLQTPLGPNIRLADVVDALDPTKDVDGVHPRNIGLLAQGRPAIVPATPAGGMEILIRHNVPISGARAVVVGRSTTVGRPMAFLLLQRDATVTICHTRTVSLEDIIGQADIVVAAAGQAGLVPARAIRLGAAVIDFGTNVVDGKMVGDVEPAAADRASLFTPVPGGTGPVTVAMLLRNTLDLYRRAIGVNQE